jgi:hypothetical protein
LETYLAVVIEHRAILGRRHASKAKGGGQLIPTRLSVWENGSQGQGVGFNKRQFKNGVQL